IYVAGGGGGSEVATANISLRTTFNFSANTKKTMNFFILSVAVFVALGLSSHPQYVDSSAASSQDPLRLK
ncbi:unnamed protein product, partial [Arabidopsis halleri]